MNTGQTLLSIGAMILLSQIVVNFYRLSIDTGTTITNAHGGITALTLATSYMELANRLEFDEVTRNDTVFSDTAGIGLGLLTPAANFGRDAGEKSMKDSGRTAMYAFDDIDDFHGDTLTETDLGGNVGTYRATFRVYYVSPDSLMKSVNIQTFLKRLDMTIWRVFPPGGDTLRTSLFIGYWKFRV
jgi:hypothetical protein